jgi:tubulin beta
LCDEHGIGGSCEYFDNDAHLDIINVLYHEAPGGKYVPRAVFLDLMPGVIGAVRALPLGCLFRPRKPRRQNWAKDHNKRVEHQFF